MTTIRSKRSLRTPWSTTVIILSLLGGLASSQGLAQTVDTKADAKLVEPFVGESTIVIIKVDPQHLKMFKPEGPVNLSALGDAATEAYEEVARAFSARVQQLQDLANGQPLFATVGIPISKNQLQAFGFRKSTSAKDAEQMLAKLRDLNLGATTEGDYVVAYAGSSEEVRRGPSRAGQVESAFAAVTEFPLQILIVPPDYVWRTIDELSPELPEQLGGGPSKVLTQGVVWASIGVDPAKLSVRATIQSKDDESAQRFAAHLPQLMSSLYDSAPTKPPVPPAAVRLLIGWLQPQTQGSQVKIAVNGLEQTSLNLAVFGGLARLLNQKTRRHSNQQSFKNILLGMHNYHDVYGAMPPAKIHRDKDGKPGLSWRVHILPFLGQAELYNQFRMDEPWDSDHNKALIPKMPRIFRSRSVPLEQSAKGQTTFLAPVGEGTVFGQDKPTSFANITDGTSNTIVLLEVKPSHAVTWTKPQDYEFAADDPLKGVLIDDDNHWLFARGDGSVQQATGDIPAKTAFHLFKMNDGQVADVPR